MKMKGTVGYAPNPNNRKRNQVINNFFLILSYINIIVLYKYNNIIIKLYYNNL